MLWVCVSLVRTGVLVPVIGRGIGYHVLLRCLRPCSSVALLACDAPSRKFAQTFPSIWARSHHDPHGRKSEAVGVTRRDCDWFVLRFLIQFRLEHLRASNK